MNASFENIQLIERLKNIISENYLLDENYCVESLLRKLDEQMFREDTTEKFAYHLVDQVRESKNRQSSIEAFIHEYDLSSEEGVVLMCLAEALLRIPDNETADKLIRDKIAPAGWKAHIGKSDSTFVNASTWGLMLTGKIVNPKKLSFDTLSKMIARVGEPVIRIALRQAMKLMGSQYVMGENIESAIRRGNEEFHKNTCFSFDMLGEAALSTQDADSYFSAYQDAIQTLGAHRDSSLSLLYDSSISIKLSALHPRFEIAQKERVLIELLPKIKALVITAKKSDVAVTIDAEEADRLELSLEIFQALFLDEEVSNWGGLGLAVQAYQKRAMAVLQWLEALAITVDVKIPVRLVKGAYWDTEIKRGQEQGLTSYSVFTRKINTDLSYLVCAQFLLKRTDQFYPQFATHNAFTLAAVKKMANDVGSYEFQRLHGMGGSLYENIIEDVRCRVYAPVGGYKDLLPYLVRRLLENGANTSFVNRIEDETIPVELVAANPVIKVRLNKQHANPNIPLPKTMFGECRDNSDGINLSSEQNLDDLTSAILSFKDKCWEALPLIGGEHFDGHRDEIRNPASNKHIVGEVVFSDRQLIQKSISIATEVKGRYRLISVEERTTAIKRFSALLQDNRHELYALCVFEAGKTISDSVAELREAIDFCHYYIAQAEKLFSENLVLPGPTGESNVLSFHGRGVFVCISPWNFPLAIFTGQIVAALLAGNCVIAKPSSNTPLIAAKIVSLLLESGIPNDVISFTPCSAMLADEELLAHNLINGVAFTGSYRAAHLINQTLANRDAPLSPLIAETGGMNVMIVDSSSLAEQVVKDVIQSAFYSAGQRCSALRILLLQEDIYDITIDLLVAATKELSIGDPINFSKDIPPVIDVKAKQKLDDYKSMMKKSGKEIFELPLPNNLREHGSYVSPAIYKIDDLTDLHGEQFGPILHVMKFKGGELNQLLAAINTMRYGLTLGIHSRINETVNYIVERVNVGNIYVNRNMVGAVVGVQPFGGEGYSGTGPKAGGPNYLQRFCVEKTVTINTAAVGGNADLLSAGDE